MDNNNSQNNDFDNDLEKDNKFCSQKENMKNNKKDIENQLIKLIEKYKCEQKELNNYVLTEGKIKINWNKFIKKSLQEKYWIIKPQQKFQFYKNQIKNIWELDSISKLKNLIGIHMVFKNYLTEEEIKRFDHYFSIFIKSNEREFCNKYKYGKILFIGGDLKCELGEMLKNEFYNSNNDYKDNNLPLYISIMTYKEYEEIYTEAYDQCDKNPEHNGFGNFKIFHQSFSKMLSTKFNRIILEKKNKKEDLIKKEQ